MADDILNDPRVSVGDTGGAAGPRIEVRPKSPEETTLQSLPSDVGAGGAAASPAGSPAGAQEAPSPPSPAEAETAAAEAPAKAHASGEGDEAYPGATPFGGQEPTKAEAEAYPGAQPLHQDAGSLSGTFASQAAAATVEGVPVAAGASMGAAIGTLGGPLAPITIPAGMIVGGLAGAIASKSVGDLYRNLLSIPRVEDLPENLKAWGYGGEFFGSAIPMVAAPLTAARTGFRFAADRAGNYLNKLLDYSAARPLHAVTGEISGVTGGTVATMTSEHYLPGNTTARLFAGLAGGFASPLRVAQVVSDPAVNIFRRAYASMTETGRRTAAAKILVEAIALAHEDPSTLAQILRENSKLGVPLTAAQSTGSKALADVEARLALKNPAFAADANKMAEDGFEAIRHMIDLLKGTGDPAALAAVAELRQAYFRALLARLVKDAEAKAFKSASEITKDTPAAYAQLSKEVTAAVEAALKQAREAERYLWQQIPSDTPAMADNILAAIALTKDRDLLTRFGERLPEILENFETTMTNPLKSGNLRATTSGELVQLRSNMLERARSAEAKGDFKDARIFGRIAEAALEDLGAIGGDVRDKVDAARSFSRELHDTFTRTFAGDTAAVNAKGADRIPPELVLRRALGSGAEGGDLRLSQLADATDFMAKKGWAEGAPEELFGRVGTIREAVDRLLRLSASDSINPVTGKISPVQLARWIAGHDALLDRFPDVRKALQNALSDATALQRIEKLAKNADPVIERQTAFAKIVSVDSPALAISKAINGSLPETDLLAMAKLAQRGGQPAVDGMAAAAWDYAFTAARGEGGFSFPKLKQAFFEPMKPGVPSLMDTLAKGGVVQRGEANAVRKLIERAENIATASQGNAKGSHAEFDPLVGVIVRSLGSELGGRAAQLTLGRSTLIANSAGARYLQGVFANMGYKGVQEVLMEAARNPKLMADLLESATSQAQSMAKAVRIHAFVLAAGLLSLESQQHLDQPEIGDRFQRDEKGVQTNITGNGESRMANGGKSERDYPTPEDAQNALENGADYGTGFETALREGKVIDATGVKGDLDRIFKRLSKGKAKPDERVVPLLTRALVATRRDPLAGLGFNPNKIAMEKSGEEFNLGGVYDPERDLVLTMSDTPSAIVHESIHRGLQELLKSGDLSDDEKKFINHGMNNELIVRYIMATKMGDVEGGQGPISKNQRDLAIIRFDHYLEDKAMLKSIEDKAAKLVAKRRPGGPA